MSKTLVQEQFGKNAAGYLTSTPHALGKSLERLVALTSPQKTWRALDIATGGGHVAYTFAPHVERMWATDITQEMLDLVKAEAAKRGLANLRTTYAKAEALPFEDASFDLVTCRIAPHHFDSIPAFPRRGAPRAQSRAACSRWSTMWCRTAASATTSMPSSVSAIRATCAPGPWTNGARRLKTAGFAIGHEEQLFKQMEFKSWAARHDATMQALPALDAGAGDARGESHAGAERRQAPNSPSA